MSKTSSRRIYSFADGDKTNDENKSKHPYAFMKTTEKPLETNIIPLDNINPIGVEGILIKNKPKNIVEELIKTNANCKVVLK